MLRRCKISIGLLRQSCIAYSALQRRQEHVGGVEGMYEIGRESGGLLLRRDLGRSVGIGDIDALKGRHDLLLDRLAVRLYNR